MNKINDLVLRYPELDLCRDDINEAFKILIGCVRGGGTIFLCGNGGSAADSEHIAGELLKGFLLERRLTPPELESFRALCPKKYDFIASKLQKGIPAISLTGGAAINSAVSNDQHADMVFAQKLYALGRAGDTLLCLSTSGNSKNVLYASLVARYLGMSVIGMTGRGGGELKQYADCTISVPKDSTYEIQELHLPVYHALCAMLEQEIFSK